MKFSIQKEQLLLPVQSVIGVVERKQTLPILSNILMQIREDEITLVATDLEIELTCTFPHISNEVGDVTLPARKLFDILKALPDETLVSFEIDEQKALIKAGKSRFTLQCLPAFDFPVLDEIIFDVHIMLPKKELRHIMEKTQFAMATSDVRYYLNGMLFDIEPESITAVATDGHRLASNSFAFPEPQELTRQIILPRKGVHEIIKLLNTEAAPVRLQINQNHLQIICDSITFTTKLIDGKFPDYKRVIPQGGDKIIAADRLALIGALERAAILSHDKFKGVKLTVDDWTLKCSVSNAEKEEADEEVEVNYQGESFVIAFNINYLTEALNALTTEVIHLIFTDASASCLIQNADSDAIKYVVMPMRI